MSSKRFLAATLILFITLTAVITYPQVLHLRDGVHDDGDPLIVTWVLAWVAHQLPSAPAHLFDANIFYPNADTLAYSETLVVPALVVAPLRWLGVGPILVYNLVFLSGFRCPASVWRCSCAAYRPRRRRGPVGPRLRISVVPHRPLSAPATAADAVPAARALGVSPATAPGAFGTACGSASSPRGRCVSCIYYGLFLVPYMARGLRHPA